MLWSLAVAGVGGSLLGGSSAVADYASSILIGLSLGPCNIFGILREVE